MKKETRVPLRHLTRHGAFEFESIDWHVSMPVMCILKSFMHVVYVHCCIFKKAVISSHIATVGPWIPRGHHLQM